MSDNSDDGNDVDVYDDDDDDDDDDGDGGATTVLQCERIMIMVSNERAAREEVGVGETREEARGKNEKSGRGYMPM